MRSLPAWLVFGALILASRLPAQDRGPSRDAPRPTRGVERIEHQQQRGEDRQVAAIGDGHLEGDGPGLPILARALR